MKTLLNQRSSRQINELIEQGWEVNIHYGTAICEDFKGLEWDVDFTKKLPNGLWDNHESGIAKNLNDAVDIAYDNIKKGRRLSILKL